MHQVTQPATSRLSGYRAAYRAGEVNHCPGCGQTQWIIGRMVAECAFCSTAVPITSGGMTGAGLFYSDAREPVALAA